MAFLQQAKIWPMRLPDSLEPTHSAPLPPWPAPCPCSGSHLCWFWFEEFGWLPGSLSEPSVLCQFSPLDTSH